ncbi:MAG: recombinase family protein [Epsilonproteobacteria bacterium]|nr:recombinase family protein [Campylobacterota bacterium]
MVIAYIRADKNFDSAYEQLKLIKSYSMANGITIDHKFIDYDVQLKTLEERSEVTKLFRQNKGATLLVSDVWVLSTNMDDLVQMFSCLLKNEYEVHFIKKSVVMTQKSSVMFVLGLLDSLRQLCQNSLQKSVGRPKGSKSSSKFDVYLEEIMNFIQEGKSVSEMARLLGVSRSSLKDYIESRELKELALDSFLLQEGLEAEKSVINTIKCPNENLEGETNE